MGLFRETMLVLVNIHQLSASMVSGRRARFSAQEQALVDSRFPGLSRGERRRLLDRGEWIDLPAGATLTEEGKPVSRLTHLAAGEAEVAYRGRVFTRCGLGCFIGEMSVLEKGEATADVALAAPARCWRIDAASLRKLYRRDETLAEALKTAFTLDWREKLMAQRNVNAIARPRLAQPA